VKYVGLYLIDGKNFKVDFAVTSMDVVTQWTITFGCQVNEIIFHTFKGLPVSQDLCCKIAFSY